MNKKVESQYFNRDLKKIEKPFNRDSVRLQSGKVPMFTNR